MTYTREQIMAMDAAQLRLAIAEVRGEANRPHLDETWYEYSIETDSGLDFADGWECRRCHSSGDDPCCPRYSTNISAAWELVEEMRASGYPVTILVMPTYTRTDVYSKDGYGVILSAEDAKAEASICRARLIWQEVEQ
jgi:hypothetical protein